MLRSTKGRKQDNVKNRCVFFTIDGKVHDGQPNSAYL